MGLGPDKVATGDPRSKVAEAAARAGTAEQMQRLEAKSGRADVLRICELRLKCVAAGTRCWGRFCEITGRQHVPPSGEAVLARPASFASGRAL